MFFVIFLRILYYWQIRFTYNKHTFFKEINLIRFYIEMLINVSEIAITFLFLMSL